MSFARHAAVILTLVALFALRVSGQDTDEVARLNARLEAQEALNHRLMERLEALEASQNRLLERIGGLDSAVPTMEHVRDDRELVLDELRSELFDLNRQLDVLPTVSGYYHFEIHNDDRSDSPSKFKLHRFGLQFAKEYDDYRLFSEIEAEFGEENEGVDHGHEEPAEGTFHMLQAWVDSSVSNALTLRAGMILVPTYWNVNHAPYTQLATRHPLLFRTVLPTSFIGVMAHGTRYWDDFGLTYYAYVGNGESSELLGTDDNEGKAVGGKLTLHLPTDGLFDTFDLSVNGYRESPDEAERVSVWGVEAQIRKGPWEVLAEFDKRDSEISRTGFFVQPSYRFTDRWTTFYRYDLLHVDDDREVQEHTLGVNYRPGPEISLKLEYFRSVHSNDEDFNGVAASIALAF